MERVQLSTINLLSFSEQEAGSNRRRPGRIRCERLRCTGGRVLDLSQTGARVRINALSAPRIGQRRTLIFQTAMGESHVFPVVVRWVRHVGVLRHEVGVEFEALDQARRTQLAEMGRVHGGRTAITDIDRAA